MASSGREGGSQDWPQVFMMPVHRDRWLGEFKRTVDQTIDLGPGSERPEELKGLEKTRIWGTRTGERNEKMWQQLRPGDIMLFYCNDWFFSAGRIDQTIRSSAGGEYIWNNEDSQLIYTLQDYHRIAIRKLDVWEWFDYKENFTRRGLSRVYPERVEQFREEVDDIWEHVTKYVVDENIEEILAGEIQISTRRTTPEIEGPEAIDIRSDHPFLAEFEADEGTLSAYRFTAPPEYWLTSVATATISFEEDSREQWEEIDTGDVILFYCQHSDLPEIEEAENGFIGAGIVRGRTTKPPDDHWWWDEHNNGDSFPLLVAFERLYFTGDVVSLVGPNPVDSRTEPIALDRKIGALTAESLPLEEAEEICEAYSERGLAISGTFSPFRRDADPELIRPRILLSAMVDMLTEVPSIDMNRPFTGQLSKDFLDGLHFPEDQDTRLISQINAALRAGKHIILTGPPGTGKTEIARRVCEHLVIEHPNLYTGFQLTTATADWSTFDTVGGYMPEETSRDGGLSFSPGIVLNRLKAKETGVQSNEPIVIDELNRADIDKSFGQLFTLLSGQSVQLPYSVHGREIELRNSEDIEGLAEPNQYFVPQSWRIFATMNTYDKTSLYEMSYAFMRRFAFIRVSAPELPDDDSIEDRMFEYVGVWEGIEWNRDVATEVGRVWQATNSAVDGRAIGPAIVRDMLGYIMSHESDELGELLSEAVISFIFPQLEGVPKRKQILDNIAGVDRVDRELLDDAARDILQVSIIEDNE